MTITSEDSPQHAKCLVGVKTTTGPDAVCKHIQKVLWNKKRKINLYQNDRKKKDYLLFLCWFLITGLKYYFLCYLNFHQMSTKRASSDFVHVTSENDSKKEKTT